MGGSGGRGWLGQVSSEVSNNLHGSVAEQAGEVK